MGNRLGSVGAALFLTAFAGIAWFVYQQSQQEERQSLRNPAPLAMHTRAESSSAAPTPKAPPPPPPIPAWRKALDLREAKVVSPSIAALPQGKKAPQKGKKKSAMLNKKRAKAPAPPELLVQDLRDGERVLYTIDPVLQQQSLDLFESKELPYAAAVLLDLRDNSVLVMAGHSSINPKADPLEIATTPWAPAASTFKTITAAALVEKGAAKPSTKVCFHGGLSGITDALLEDNKKRDTRCESLTDAVAHSHNVIMAKLALRHLSKDNLEDIAERFMFSKNIPFEVPITPSPFEFPEKPKARAKVAAGFWHTDLSAIHGALIASIFARNGKFLAPHMVAERLLPNGETLLPELPEEQRKIPAATAKKVGAMMVHTTTRGTARRSFRRGRRSLTPGVVVAGKTGALTGKRPPNYNYNWLIGFAPAQRPEVAFAVVLANPPKWRIKAHYAASKLIQNYWARRKIIQSKPPVTLTKDGVKVLDAPSQGPTQAWKTLPPKKVGRASHAENVPRLPGAKAR